MRYEPLRDLGAVATVVQANQHGPCTVIIRALNASGHRRKEAEARAQSKRRRVASAYAAIKYASVLTRCFAHCA